MTSGRGPQPRGRALCVASERGHGPLRWTGRNGQVRINGEGLLNGPNLAKVLPKPSANGGRMSEIEVVRVGTTGPEEALERLLALRPACARSSLLAHRTGENLAEQLDEPSRSAE